jgi:outer membrane protein assembly factor BamD (BamD/ComL family)
MHFNKSALTYLAALFGLIGIVFQSFARDGGIVKKSLKLIKVGNLIEANKLLRSANARKNADFGSDYVFSIYFLSPYQKTLKLDSSYIFCLSAIEKFSKEDAAGKRKYIKLEIDSLELYSRKDYLDSLGFSQAERLESEAAYQYFLDRFPQSRLAETAKQKRASLAFQRAKQANSFDAFMAFLDKYPDAEQARTAKEISDLLVFENTAKKGKISDWEGFIERNPNNPYVLKAQNRLYELSTLYHTPESYQKFVEKYPDNPNTSKAWEWIFYLDKSLKSLTHLDMKYPGFPILRFDSKFGLKNQYLISFLERGKFGLMMGNGQVFIKPVYDSIPEEYRCEMIWAGFLKVFKNKKASIFSFDSIPISESEFDNAEFFADGVLKTFKNGKQGLISMAGYQILGSRYESITSLTPNLLSIQQGTKFYLFTSKGQKIDIQPLDEVVSIGKFLGIKVGDKYALIEENDVLKNLENEPIETIFKYIKLQKLSDSKLLLFQENEVNFLSGNKVYVLKNKGNSSFFDSPWGVQIQNEKEVSVVDSNGNAFPRNYQSLNISGNFAIAKSDSKFGIIDKEGVPIVDFVYDTISLLLHHCFLAKKGNKKYVVFESGKRVYFSGNKYPEVLRYNTRNSISDSYFVVLTDSILRKAVFNKNGKLVIPFVYDQISLLDQHLFSIQQDRKTGIADTNGKILLKPSLSGASPINKDFVCVAKGKVFSIINPFTKRQIPTSLTAVAKPYGPSKWFFIVRVKDKAGLMDGGGKLVIPNIYEEILYWNPTRCLVKRGGFWYFYVMESGKELVKAMKSVRIILERENEIIYQVESDKKVGIESTLRGEIAPTDSDEIIAFESENGTYFFAGKRIQQSSVYNLSYIDQNGQLIKTQLLTEDEYDQIICD